MSFSFNRAQVIGNLTRDPEVRQTPSGVVVASISVATNRKWTNKQTNQVQEEVEFHNVVLWNRLAEIAQQYLRKGAKVFVEGRLKTSTWEDPDGKKNYKTEIIGEQLIMLDSKGGGAPMQPISPSNQAKKPMPSAEMDAIVESGSSEEVKIDDLPF